MLDYAVFRDQAHITLMEAPCFADAYTDLLLRDEKYPPDLRRSISYDKNIGIAPLSEACRSTLALQEINLRLKPIITRHSLAALYSGSFAYGPFYSTRATSDIEFMIVVECWKDASRLLEEINTQDFLIGDSVSMRILSAYEPYTDVGWIKQIFSMCPEEADALGLAHGKHVELEIVTNDTLQKTVNFPGSINYNSKKGYCLATVNKLFVTPYSPSSRNPPMYNVKGELVDILDPVPENYYGLMQKQYSLGGITDNTYIMSQIGFFLLVNNIFHDPHALLCSSRDELVGKMSEYLPKKSDFRIVRQGRMPQSYLFSLYERLYQ